MFLVLRTVVYALLLFFGQAAVWLAGLGIFLLPGGLLLLLGARSAWRWAFPAAEVGPPDR